MNTFLITGLILGLSSSLHCIGMCGPIAMAIPVNRKNNFTILGGIFQYNLGRVFTYSLLGIAVGSIGFTVASFGVLQGLSILSGLFLILFAWRKRIGHLFNTQFGFGKLNGFVSSGIGKVLQSSIPMKLPLLGALNGLLPCGMVYIALMNALLAGNAVGSALAMASFGLGTLPAMISVGFAAGKITGVYRNKLQRSVPYLLTLVGLLVVMRGMNLGIPFISPKAEMALAHSSPNKNQPTPAIKMDCCHSADKTCD